MVSVRYGGKGGQAYDLTVSNELVAVRTCNRKPLMPDRPYEVAPVSAATRAVLREFQQVSEFREAGVEVLQTRFPQPDSSLRDTARSVLKAEPEIRFAGRLLVTAAQVPVLYTENFFVKFDSDVDAATCLTTLQRYNLTVKHEVAYALNAYFVNAPEGTGLEIFAIADRLLQEEIVELCHPELITESYRRQVFPQQWHLNTVQLGNQVIDASANVEAAWSLTRGAGITIAVIDTGIDIDHEEFRSSGKLVSPRDATRGTDDPRPRGSENHGTACAGVACADGNFGAAGVAPQAKLMPIRLASALGSQAEAEAFYWAARNGADVISCSWGPADGDWSNPNDPLHDEVTPLPDSTRLAIDYAVSQGRSGKGCVICWAAGNGNESVDNDGYASYANVIAVAACNDTGQRSAYSDFGNAIWCAFPSNDPVQSLTPGIWTTDRSGAAGYNPGNTAAGDEQGNYTNSFGGTSSACPGVAGVAALVLARNPDLRWDQVRDILKQCCDQIDVAGGQYNADRRSPLYGYGRLNARRAVELAIPAQPTPARMYRAMQEVPIHRQQRAALSMMVPVTNPLKSIRVSIEVEHPHRDNLIVLLKPPQATAVISVALHNRGGRGTRNINTVYDQINTPGLVSLRGKSPKGNWTVEVIDQVQESTGKLRSFTLELGF